MTKIYISPTNQTNNPYAVGNTNEGVQMNRVSQAMHRELSRYVVDLRLGDYTKRMWELSGGKLVGGRIKEAADWGADWYLEIHSNATGSINTAVGASQYYRKGYSADRDKMAKALNDALNRVCPYPANRTGLYDGYAMEYGAVVYSEQSGMRGFLIETNFHDNPTIARWIIDNVDAIGKAMAKAVADTLGLKLKDDKPTPTPEPKPDPFTVKLEAGTPIYPAFATDFVEKTTWYTITERRGRQGRLKSGRGVVVLPEEG